MNSRPNILYAPHWYDTAIHQGIACFGVEKQWHINADLAFSHSIGDMWYRKGYGTGVISLISGKGPLLDQLRRAADGLPWVDMSLSLPELRIPRIVTDNERIGKTAADYFLKKGFRYFAFYNYHQHWMVKDRADAFIKRLEENGKKLSGIIKRPIMAESLSLRKFQERLVEQIRYYPAPLAVFSASDRAAVEFLEACVCFGIKIPDQVAVLGVNNTSLLCENQAVPVSSIDPDHKRVGYTAAEHLFRLIEKGYPEEPYTVKIPPVGVIERQSTSTVAVTDKKLLKAVNFISYNYFKQIGVQDIAGEVGLSQRGLENLFKKHLNETPGRMLRRKRLEYSVKLLRETDLTLEDIAKICGYSSGGNFAVAYKQHFGNSPSIERG